ncbi:MAG: hypothetical protein ABFS14_09410 [Gemmatimonadota bacterium]
MQYKFRRRWRQGWPTHRQTITRTVALAVGFLTVGAPRLYSQEAAPDPIDDLADRLEQIAVRLDSLESGLCMGRPLVFQWQPTGDAAADSLAETVSRLAARLARAEARTCSDVTGAQEEPPAEPPVPPVDELAAIRAAADSAAAAAQPRPVAAGEQQVRRSLNALNPEISVTADLRGQLREGDPQEDNFELREVEFSFQSNLDPVSKARVYVTFEDEAFDLEEGFITWTGLPGHIRADAGKLRAEVGELNRWHLHALPEGEYPLVYRRFFGEEGLVSTGLSLYSALPFSIGGGTPEVWFQATTANSEPLAGDSRQLMLLGRFKTFWQVSRSTYVQAGLTGLGVNNASADLQSRVYGADVRLTVRPPRTGTRRELTLRAEGYVFHADQSGLTTDRYGLFADAQYRASRRWVLGVRYDRVETPRGALDTEWAITPAITWWQSEFVYVRLEGRHEESELFGEQEQIGLQVVWSVGPHKHETY